MEQTVNLDFIKQRRKELNITQSEMAEKLGMGSNVSYCKYETGAYRFNADIIPRLASALRVPIKKIFL